MIKSSPTKFNPKIGLFDIETAPTLGYFWGKLWETNIIKVDVPWYMLCFSYKWLGKGRVYTHSLREYPHYKKNLQDDGRLIKELHKFFDEADIIIGHNGDRFDIRKSNARFIKHGLKPPSPSTSIDTLKIARKHFQFDSNKLNDLGIYLGVGHKIVTTGFDLWERCMRGEEKAWEKIEAYNRRDVLLLERVYNKLKPYTTTHPNLEIFDERGCCPVCRSLHVERAGTRVTRLRKYTRYKCSDCGHWFQGSFIPRDITPNTPLKVY
jgi:DNA polymerase elongation subunit (family B)